MNIPCPVCVRCVDPAEPVANYSSEDADVDHLFCYGSANGGLLPGAGRNWNTGDCIITWGPVSCYATTDEDCQACIQQSYWTCNPPGTPRPPWQPFDGIYESAISGPPPPGSPPGTPNQPRMVFWNLEESCTITCPDGTTTTYTVPPYRFGAWSQEEANRMAASYCQRTVQKIQICLGDLPDWCCVGQSGDFALLELERGSLGPYTFSVSSGSLPTGMELITEEGGYSATIFGEATEAGVFTFTIRVENELGHRQEKTFTIDVFGIVDPEDIPDAKCDKSYSYQVQTAGGHGAVTFTLVSSFAALPAGLSLSSTGLISGTATGLPSTTLIKISLEDSSTDDAGNPSPRRCVQDLTVRVTGPKFLAPWPSNGTKCTAYSAYQFTTSPSAASCLFSGSVPPGLTLGAHGAVTGMPTASGSQNFVITATDADGNSNTFEPPTPEATITIAGAGDTCPRSPPDIGTYPNPTGGWYKWSESLTGGATASGTLVGGTVDLTITVPTGWSGTNYRYYRCWLRRCNALAGYSVHYQANSYFNRGAAVATYNASLILFTAGVWSVVSGSVDSSASGNQGTAAYAATCDSTTGGNCEVRIQIQSGGAPTANPVTIRVVVTFYQI